MGAYTSIFIFLGGIFWTIASGVTIYLFTMVISLKERVQRVEDIQGTKLDNLSADFKEFQKEMKHDLGALKTALHREKNAENQLNTTLTLVLKELEKRMED